MDEYKRLKRLVESYKYKVDIELYNLCGKEKWDSVDVAKFTELRKFKYGNNRIKKTAGEFFAIRKQHTEKKEKLVGSWEECNITFHNAGYKSLDYKDFEGFKVPFTPYHQSIVDCDIVTIVGIQGKLEKNGNIYYICSSKYQGMWLIGESAPEPFNGLIFSYHGSIDFVEKDGEFIDCDGKWNAYQIYRDDE